MPASTARPVSRGSADGHCGPEDCSAGFDGTAKQLEAIKAKVTTGDADLIGDVASAYAAIAANPGDTEAQSKLSTSSKALGAGCEMATTAPGHN